MKKRTTLPKTCISSLSDVITYNNTKMHGNYPIWRKERHYETRVLSVFFSFLGTKISTRMNSSLYVETEQH